MNISDLVSMALLINCMKTDEALPVGHKNLLENLLKHQKDAVPLRTLGVSLARAIALGYYTSPALLEQVWESIYRDGSGYFFYEGIRVSHWSPPAPSREEARKLLDACNRRLSSGVVLTGSTATNPLLDDAADAKWAGAVLALDSRWANSSTGEVAFVLSNLTPLGNPVVAVLSRNGFWEGDKEPSGFLGAAQLLKSNGFAQTPYPEDYSAFAAEMEQTSVSTDDLLRKLQLTYLN